MFVELVLNLFMTDYYQLIMSAVYFAKGRQNEEATFYMHWRNPPFKGGYTLAAGLEGVIEFLKNFKFTEKEIQYLASLKMGKTDTPMFTLDFLNYLKNMKLDLNVQAVPEGTVMIGQGPVIRISGPLIQCQIVETAILNIMNSNSIVATRAARVMSVLEKYKASAADFSLRRSSSLDLNVARSSFIGGFGATSNVHAAKELGLNPTGTMAHAYVTSFQEEGKSNKDVELTAFKEFLKLMPGNSVLLIDTFNTEVGITNAIQAAKDTNTPLIGVRLDSGDLFGLSYFCHHELEKAREAEAGKPEAEKLFNKTNIYLTDGLDEEKIEKFFEKDAELVEVLSKKHQAIYETYKSKPFPAKVFGVGTKLGNPGPLDGGVYKLSAFKKPDGDWTPTMKIGGGKGENYNLISAKTSLPGEALNTVRLFNETGKIVGEVIVNGKKEVDAINSKTLQVVRVGAAQTAETPGALPTFDHAEALLVPIFTRDLEGQEARLTYTTPGIVDIQTRAKKQLESLPDDLKALNKEKHTSEKTPMYVLQSIFENVRKIIDKSKSDSDPENPAVGKE